MQRDRLLHIAFTGLTEQQRGYVGHTGRFPASTSTCPHCNATKGVVLKSIPHHGGQPIPTNVTPVPTAEGTVLTVICPVCEHYTAMEQRA